MNMQMFHSSKTFVSDKRSEDVEISEDNKTYSWEEIENSDEFKQLIEQSRNQIKNGEYEEFSDELIDSIFNKK